MEKKQSSITHIRSWVRTNGEMSEDGKSITYSCAELEAVIRESKAMHKEEVTKAFDEGQECEYQVHINSAPKYDSETYYNETFGETKN